MSYIGWAYGVGVVQLFISFLDIRSNFPVAVIIMILLSKDAQERSLSQGHSAWGLLGIIGVAIYHLAFAKNAPVRRKVPFVTLGKNK